MMSYTATVFNQGIIIDLYNALQKCIALRRHLSE